MGLNEGVKFLASAVLLHQLVGVSDGCLGRDAGEKTSPSNIEIEEDVGPEERTLGVGFG